MTDAAQDETGPSTGTVTAPKGRWRLRRRPDQNPERPDYAVVRRLVLGSALMLFLELALIRWLGANVVHLSYFSNFVLLGSFLGIGLGFLIARKRWSVLPAAPVILAAVGDPDVPGTGDHRPGRRRGHLLHLAEHLRPAGVAGAADDLPAGGGLPGRAGRGRRPMLRPPAPAHRIPLGPGRLADRHRVVHPLSFLRAPSVVWGIVVTVGFVLLIDKLAALAGRGLRTGDGRRARWSRRCPPVSPGRRTTRSTPRTGSSAMRR